MSRTKEELVQNIEAQLQWLYARGYEDGKAAAENPQEADKAEVRRLFDLAICAVEYEMTTAARRGTLFCYKPEPYMNGLRKAVEILRDIQTKYTEDGAC